MKFRIFSILVLSFTLLLVIRVSNIVMMSVDEDAAEVISELFIANLNAKTTTENDGGDTESDTISDDIIEEDSYDESIETVEPQQNERVFTRNQLDLLDSLSERRRELEKHAKEIEMKENVLRATSLRIESKMSELQKLEDRVKRLLDKYNERESMKIKSLVKIYESMKAKDAARIFEQLDMDILLQVINNMKESRVAPILARLSPQRAKEITIKFAAEKKLQNFE
jgi:flagellar motility protein MotE (MotC chaperone)